MRESRLGTRLPDERRNPRAPRIACRNRCCRCHRRRRRSRWLFMPPSLARERVGLARALFYSFPSASAVAAAAQGRAGISPPEGQQRADADGGGGATQALSAAFVCRVVFRECATDDRATEGFLPPFSSFFCLSPHVLYDFAQVVSVNRNTLAAAGAVQSAEKTALSGTERRDGRVEWREGGKVNSKTRPSPRCRRRRRRRRWRQQ